MIWEEKKLRKIVENSLSVAECLKKLGLVARGRNFETFRNKVKKWSIDVAHFDPKASQKARLQFQFKQTVSDGEVFCKNSKVSQHCLVVRYKRISPPEKCSSCNTGLTYNNLPLTLQLDHTNGDSKDNRLENLRWLCPNCHSQTETYGTKGKRFNVRTKPKPNKGRIGKGSQNPKSRKVDYVAVINKYEELNSYLGTAKIFGISDNAVKKIIKRYSVVNSETVRHTL